MLFIAAPVTFVTSNCKIQAVTSFYVTLIDRDKGHVTLYSLLSACDSNVREQNTSPALQHAELLRLVLSEYGKYLKCILYSPEGRFHIS